MMLEMVKAFTLSLMARNTMESTLMMKSMVEDQIFDQTVLGMMAFFRWERNMEKVC